MALLKSYARQSIQVDYTLAIKSLILAYNKAF